MKERVTRMAYYPYLLSVRSNDTLTNFAGHYVQFSHHAINYYLRNARLTLRLRWERVAPHLVPASAGYVIFDDPVLDMNFSFAIELIRRQYSGNARSIITSIRVVTYIYVNPATAQFWLIDYPIYDPDGDGKTKLDHVREMLENLIYHKHLPFHAVLMDIWYATKDLMLYVKSLQKAYY